MCAVFLRHEPLPAQKEVVAHLYTREVYVSPEKVEAPKRNVRVVRCVSVCVVEKQGILPEKKTPV